MSGYATVCWIHNSDHFWQHSAKNVVNAAAQLDCSRVRVIQLGVGPDPILEDTRTLPAHSVFVTKHQALVLHFFAKDAWCQLEDQDAWLRSNRLQSTRLSTQNSPAPLGQENCRPSWKKTIKLSRQSVAFLSGTCLAVLHDPGKGIWNNKISELGFPASGSVGSAYKGAHLDNLLCCSLSLGFIGLQGLWVSQEPTQKPGIDHCHVGSLAHEWCSGMHSISNQSPSV